MQDSNKTDSALLADFQKEILSKVPHVEQSKVVNATRMADVTADFKQCAKTIFGVDLADKDLRVFAKFDSNLLGGSIKARPAINILHDAIATGKLKRGQTIFEATSGNFGIALGLIGKKLGLNVVTLVSRKLQEGVFDELRNEDIKILNLDMDICPAPGMKGDANLMAAKATAWNVRAQLVELGFDATPFDNARADIEAVLAKQDIINLAKLLAKIYDGCFCPEQYDNELNVQAHRTVTGPEIEQQLREQNQSLADYKIVCTFGTGGTSGGLSRYMSEKHNKKAVHVVFPLPDQDVAGIRTKAKGAGLKFYEPDRYANQHEVDFQQARKLLKFFVDKGHDMGESSALALYAAMQMANFGGEGRFVVLVADGIAKYKKALEAMKQKPKRLEVQLNEAASNIKNYNKIVWIHTMYTPKKEGIELIAKELGVDPSQIVVPKAREVEEILMTQKIPKELDSALGSDAKPLLVCMMGNTSLRVAQVLGQKGIEAESLVGGINALSQGKGKQIAELVKMATE